MLRQLMLSKKIAQARTILEGLVVEETNLVTRKAELETAITEAVTDEEIKVVEEGIEALENEEKEATEKKSKLEGEISKLEVELEELKSKEPKNNEGEERSEENTIKRGVEGKMITRDRVTEMVARDEVKQFLTRTREFMEQKRTVTGGDLLIPTIVLPMLRDLVSSSSKLLSKVNYKPVKGKARQNITGTIPEAVWTEMTGALNELDIKFNQVEVDGYKVGGFVVIPNSTLKDSDENLFNEIITQLAKAIAVALDKAILYGLGTKQPLGIVTRLAQTSKPSNYSDNAPKWVDLHTTNVKSTATTGAALIGAIVTAFGACKNNFSDGRKFFAMNSLTHSYLLTTLLNFNAAGAIATGFGESMPIIGGDIVILDFMTNYDIVGGYGDLYLLAEREGTVLASSDQVQFIEDNTVFKGLARYDGVPVIAEGFFSININNTTAATTKTFEFDYANTNLGVLGITSVAGTKKGDSKVTITGAEISGTTLGFKFGGTISPVKSGDKATGWEVFESEDDITATESAILTVVEFDAKGKAIKAGATIVVTKTT